MGNTTCPYGANSIYKGTVLGGYYTHKGSPSNMLCLPINPMHPLLTTREEVITHIASVEYQTSGPIINAHDHKCHVHCVTRQ